MSTTLATTPARLEGLGAQIARALAVAQAFATLQPSDFPTNPDGHDWLGQVLLTEVRAIHEQFQQVLRGAP